MSGAIRNSCPGSRRRGSRSNSETEMVADLVVGFKALKETFTSKVAQAAAGRDRHRLCRRAAQISPQQLAVPRRRHGRHRGRFLRRFRLRVRIFEAIAGQMFDRALRRMINAFEERARRALRRRPNRGAAAARARRAPPEGGRRRGRGRRTSGCRRRSRSGSASAVGAGEDHRADRLAVRCRPRGPAMPVIATAASAPDARERALRHRPGDRDRDRAERLQHVLADAEQLGLRLVGIGDEARLEHVGASRQSRSARRRRGRRCSFPRPPPDARPRGSPRRRGGRGRSAPGEAGNRDGRSFRLLTQEGGHCRVVRARRRRRPRPDGRDHHRRGRGRHDHAGWRRCRRHFQRGGMR